LPYTIWMPRIDTVHAVTIPSPTTTDLVITTPRIPGLEVHIPAGTVITDHEHHRVRQISITPLPLARPPVPLAGLNHPGFSKLQPGAGDGYTRGKHGVRVVYPNGFRWPAGPSGEFGQYDPEEYGGYLYGFGRVTADERQVVPDPAVAIYRFTGAM